MMEFKLYGNWPIVARGFEKLPNLVKSSAIWGQRKVAESLVRIAKDHINNQDLPWAPRSSTTNSGDSRVLVDTEAYYNAIKAWKKGDTYHAGVPTNATNGRGMPIHIYALIHEYGSKFHPARPLWRPTYKEIGGKKGIQQIISRTIKQKILTLRNNGLDIK